MNETYIWKMLKGPIKSAGGHCTRHENNGTLGVPDISYGLGGVQGWVESKHINKWPKKGTIVKFKKFTVPQKRWIYNRGKAGGKCFVFLLIGEIFAFSELLIFRWQDVMELGTVTREGLYKLAVTSDLHNGIMPDYVNILSGHHNHLLS